VTQELKFTGPVLADIYLGKIKKWSDAQIAKLNTGVKLPDTEIAVVHRSEGSGTTFIWCDFLSKVSPDFKSKVGASTSVNWPTGVGGKGNEGVSGLVTQTPGAIGYVELIYAIQNKISYGSVQNVSGKFLKASLETVTAAAAGAAKAMPADFRVSITNAPGADAYPISSFTWMLLYQDSPDKAQGKIMAEFVKWMLGPGQQYCKGLGYAPLPKEVVDMELKQLATIK
jgi:phosphate transport system substrate-binding protein